MSFTFQWVPTPGQNNNFVANNNGTGHSIIDPTQQNPFDSPLYICIPPTTFQGGNSGSDTIYNFAKLIAYGTPTVTTVQNPGLNYNGKRFGGGTFTLGGNPCGNYEYNVLTTTTLNQTSVATLFSSNLDLSTWIVVRGNLTIASSTVLIPNVNPSYTPPSTATYTNPPDPNAKRKLFMVVYVTGNLIFTDSSSSISMSACGGNTDTTGANIGSFNITIANNIYNNSTPNITPVIQSVGGAGGNSVSSAGGNGNNGNNGASSSDGSSLTTGGGGSGSATQAASGAGGTGSAFSGGAGGGSSLKSNPGFAGSSLGGAGGNGAASAGAAGGTGNPYGTAGTNGLTGTGGLLIIICEGNITPNGATVQANGVNSAATGSYGGGASGGGITVVIQSSSIGNFPGTKSLGGGNTGSAGGAGGNGSGFNYGLYS